jgi:hypothetical protein
MEGVVLYYRQYELEDEIKETYHIIDDSTIEQPTLALRRIELLKMQVKLQKLGRATFFLADFIKLANKNTWFIDSAGTVFQYKKHKRAKLIFKKIKRIIPILTGGAIIEVEDSLTRFKTLHTPDASSKYAGLLLYGMGYILYGLYPDKLEDSWRMI